MTTTELEQVIRDYFLDIFKKEYIGKLKIEVLNPGYKISFGLDAPDKPRVICGMLPDDQFLPFLKKELRASNIPHTYYGELNMIYPYDCGPRNTQCSCHKKN